MERLRQVHPSAHPVTVSSGCSGCGSGRAADPEAPPSSPRPRGSLPTLRTTCWKSAPWTPGLHEVGEQEAAVVIPVCSQCILQVPEMGTDMGQQRGHDGFRRLAPGERFQDAEPVDPEHIREHAAYPDAGSVETLWIQFRRRALSPTSCRRRWLTLRSRRNRAGGIMLGEPRWNWQMVASQALSPMSVLRPRFV